MTRGEFILGKRMPAIPKVEIKKLDVKPVLSDNGTEEGALPVRILKCVRYDALLSGEVLLVRADGGSYRLPRVQRTTCGLE